MRTHRAVATLITLLLAGSLIYGVARAGAAVDPQIFAIALRSVKTRVRYDAARWTFGDGAR